MNNLLTKADIINDSGAEIKILKEYCENRKNVIDNLYNLHKQSGKKGKKARKSGSAAPTVKIDTALTQEQSEALDKRFEHLLSSLKKEGFIDTDECLIKVSQARISAVTHGRWREAQEQLEEGIETMKSFDINKFVERYNEYKHASHALKNKNIVLFLGSTGVGKSTTIHYLRGSEMKQDPKTDHISAVNVKNEYLKSIEILDTKGDSVTRYITPVPVNLFDIVPDLEQKNDTKKEGGKQDSNRVNQNPNSVVLCDTPGFEDSGGSEIKLANTLSLLDAMYAANQITIIFLINRDLFSSAGKSVAFKQSAQNLQNLLRHYRSDDNIMDKLDDIQLVFTKFDYKKFPENDDIIDFFRTYCEETQDKTGKFLAEYIHRKLDGEDVIRVNPLEGKERHSVFQQVFDGTTWIEATEDNFKGVNHDSAMKAAINQALADFKIVNTIVKSNQGLKTNFKFIETKLDQMYALNRILDQPQIESSLKDSIESVSQLWTGICGDALRNFNNKVSKDVDAFEYEVGYLRQVVDELLIPYQQLQQKYFAKTITAREMRLNAKLQFRQLVSKIKLGFANQNNNPSMTNTLVQHIIKIEVALKYFVEWRIEFFNQISRLQKELEHCIKNNEFGNVAIALNVMNQTISALKDTREFGSENAIKLLEKEKNEDSEDNKEKEQDDTVQTEDGTHAGGNLNSVRVASISVDTVEKMTLLMNDTKVSVIQHLKKQREKILIAMGILIDDDESMYEVKAMSMQDRIEQCQHEYNVLRDASKTVQLLCNENDLAVLSKEITSIYTSATLILKKALKRLQTQTRQVLEDRESSLSSYDRSVITIGNGNVSDNNDHDEKSSISTETPGVIIPGAQQQQLVSRTAQKWENIRQMVDSMSDLLNISEEFKKSHSDMRDAVIDEIKKYLKSNMNINSNQDHDIINQTLKWMKKCNYGDTSELEINYQEQLVGKLNNLTHLCQRTPLSLDRYGDSLNNIKMIVTDIRDISNELSEMAPHFDDMIRGAIDVLRDRIQAMIGDAISTDLNLEDNNKVNIQIRKDYLEKLNVYYEKLYFDEYSNKLIAKVFHQDAFDEITSDKIINRCKVARDQVFLAEYRRLTAIQNEYKSAVKSISVYTRLKYMRNNLPSLRSAVLKKYHYQSKKQLDQDYTNIKQVLPQTQMRKLIQHSDGADHDDDKKVNIITDDIRFDTKEFQVLNEIIAMKTVVTHVENLLTSKYGVTKKVLLQIRQKRYMNAKIEETNQQLLQSMATGNRVNSYEENSDKYYFSNKLNAPKAEKLMEFIQGCQQITRNEGNDVEIKSYQIVTLIEPEQDVLVRQYLEEYGRFRCNTINAAFDYFSAVVDSNYNNDNNSNNNNNNNNNNDIVEEKRNKADEKDEKKSGDDGNYKPQLFASSNNTISDVAIHGNSIAGLEERVNIEQNFAGLTKFVFGDWTRATGDQLLDRWITKLNNIFDRFDTFISRPKDQVLLSRQLSLVMDSMYVLKRVDHCNLLGDSKHFEQLYQKVTGLFEQEHEELRQSIDNKDYKAVSTHLRTYDRAKRTHATSDLTTFNYDEAARLVTEMITEVYDQVLKLTQFSNVTLSNFTKIEEKLNQMLNVLKTIESAHIIPFLFDNAPTMFAVVLQDQEKIKRQVNQFYKTKKKKIRQYISESNYDFGPAQIDIEILKRFEPFYDFVVHEFVYGRHRGETVQESNLRVCHHFLLFLFSPILISSDM